MTSETIARTIRQLTAIQQRIQDEPSLDVLIAGDQAMDVLALDCAIQALEAQQWRDITEAPKGTWLNGPNDTRHPDYVEPPKLWLLLKDGQRCVGYADAYYAEGGGGFDGGPYWVEQFSGERVTPVKWAAIPAPPLSEDRVEK